MKISLKRFSICWVLNFYFALQIIDATFGMIGKPGLTKFGILLMFAAIYVSFLKLKDRKNIPLDSLVLGYAVVFMMIGLLMDYQKQLWWYGVKTQLFFMLYFLIGRYDQSDFKIFRYGLIAMVAACVIGIPLYLFPPSWYIDYKAAATSVNGESAESINALLRFSSVWSTSYWISYGSAIFYTYILHRAFIKKTINIVELFLLVFFVAICLLTQQRAPFVLIILSSVFYSVYPQPRGINGKGNFKFRLLFLYGAILLAVVYLLLYSGLETMSFVAGRYDEMSSGSFLRERTKIYEHFLVPSVLGHGIGVSSHLALDFNMDSCADQMYLRILYETGIVGSIWMFIIIGSVLFESVKQLRYCQFEFLVVVFYLIAMTGADCLALMAQHTPIFWYCCGRICNKELIRERKQDYIANFN